MLPKLLSGRFRIVLVVTLTLTALFYALGATRPLQAAARGYTTPSGVVATCQPSGGSGGLPAGSHEIVIAGRPAHVIVSPVYDPQTPTYLSYYLHGDEGGYNYNQYSYTAIRPFVEQAGWIYVAPQAPPSVEHPDAHPWYGDGDPGEIIQANADFLSDVFEYMFDHYNVCTNILFGGSASGGSWFYDRYFFPRYGDRYPAYMNIGCGAGRLTSYASSYEHAVALSQNADVVARSELHYTIGTADFLYDEFLVSSATYRELGFNVSTDILQDVEHCAYDNSAKSAAYWEQKWANLLVDTPLAQAQIVQSSGNDQVAFTESSYAEPLVITVLDEENRPLAGVIVEFRVVPPADSPTYAHYAELLTPLVITNDAGEAQTFVDAGRTAGNFQVEAKIVAVDRTASFALHNMSALPATINQVSGSHQEALLGELYAAPLVIEALNDEGIPVPGVPISFVVYAGYTGASVTLSADMVVTDEKGRAAVTARANEVAGNLYVDALHAHYYAYLESNFELRNIASLDDSSSNPTRSLPDIIRQISGNDQAAVIGEPYAAPLVIEALDNEGAPIPGLPILFTAYPGSTGASVTLSADRVVTDKDGRASITVQANQVAGRVRVDAYHYVFIEPNLHHYVYIDAEFRLLNTLQDGTAPLPPDGIYMPLLRR